MHTEQIRKAWSGYLDSLFESAPAPHFFENPICGTCAHWVLIDGEALSHLRMTCSPDECDQIENGLAGHTMRTYSEAGKVIESYRNHRFYGWCRRFPPIPRTGYSIITFRSIFSFQNRSIPKNISEYDFPVMPHECSCGEWAKAKWVAEFTSERGGRKD